MDEGAMKRLFVRLFVNGQATPPACRQRRSLSGESSPSPQPLRLS
jgi:hypothetical protein